MSAPSPSTSLDALASHTAHRSARRRRHPKTVQLLCVLAGMAAAMTVLVPGVSAQSSNVTAISGTWSSGSGAVRTGPGFANPVNYSFTAPATSGVSYSFTDDGYFEEAQFRYTANGSAPNCVTALLMFQHGTYKLLPNGSITTQPIAADGRIQVQDPCAAQSSIITYYYNPALFRNWVITNDVNHNQYMLQLYGFDGAPLPRQWLTFRPPSMWQNAQLTTNSTAEQEAIVNGGKLPTVGAAAPSALALSRHGAAGMGLACLAVLAALLL